MAAAGFGLAGPYGPDGAPGERWPEAMLRAGGDLGTALAGRTVGRKRFFVSPHRALAFAYLVCLYNI